MRRKDLLNMAIYHLHIDCYRRSEGKTSVGGLAYRRGIKEKCNVTGKHYDFRKKGEVIYSEFVNAECDSRLHDFQSIKNIFEQVEKSEKHPRATLGREIECALPNELSTKQQIELTQYFISRIKTDSNAENAFFDFSIHNIKDNQHVHISMSERELQKTCDGYKLSKNKRRDWHEKTFVEQVRKIWEEEVNNALVSAGVEQRVDRRTLAAQGVNQIPTLHEGRARHFKGDRKMMNDEIKKTNALLVAPVETEVEDLSSIYAQNNEYGEIRNTDDEIKPSYQYRLAEDKYKGFMIFGLTYFNGKNPKYVTLYFSDRSKIVDNGNVLNAQGGTAKANATRMVNLAHLKGWKSITFTGSPDFIREAMSQALFMGMEVKTESEEQERILRKLQEESSAVAKVVSAKQKQPLQGIQNVSSVPNLATASGVLQKINQQKPQIPTRKGFGL